MILIVIYQIHGTLNHGIKKLRFMRYSGKKTIHAQVHFKFQVGIKIPTNHTFILLKLK